MVENIENLVKTLLPGLGGVVGGVIGASGELQKTISGIIGLLPLIKEIPNIIYVPHAVEYLSAQETLIKETIELVESLTPLLGKFATLLPEMIPLLTEVLKVAPSTMVPLIKGGLPVLNEVLFLIKGLTRGLVE